MGVAGFAYHERRFIMMSELYKDLRALLAFLSVVFANG